MCHCYVWHITPLAFHSHLTQVFVSLQQSLSGWWIGVLEELYHVATTFRDDVGCATDDEKEMAEDWSDECDIAAALLEHRKYQQGVMGNSTTSRFSSAMYSTVDQRLCWIDDRDRCRPSIYHRFISTMSATLA